MSINLKDQLATLPAKPGVYIYKDAKGNVLYVGKAKILKNRVRSYFARGNQLDASKQQMVRLIASLETIATDTENEALVLEANLIRQHQPPYNVVLRDDKYYLFIKITNDNPPRIFPVRRLKKDKARYFGPYSSARSVRATLKLLRRIFPFKEEKDDPREKIFPHPLFTQPTLTLPSPYSGRGEVRGDSTSPYLRRGRPEGPGEVKRSAEVDAIIRFLKGERREIIDALRVGMKQAAKEKQFERAAIFRDQLLAVERLEGYQKVYLPRPESFDVISIARQATMSAANIFAVRRGKLLNKNTFLLRHRLGATEADVLRQFMLQYYSVAQDIPKTILLPLVLPDAAALAAWINKDQVPELVVPKRGVRRQLLRMGEVNAQQLLHEEDTSFRSEERLKNATTELARALNLWPANSAGGPLGRIETYDVSNIQGNLATASMVVFEHGQPKTSQYRKFRLKLEGTPNDFAMLQEALRRRFGHHQKEWTLPDLIMIDGGKGQLAAAQKILNELKITVPVISLAKREEEIFTAGRKESIRLPYDSDAMYLIQRMRDEAHRFTITYHRLLRSKKQQRSILDEAPGIGPKMKKKLLNHFGSLKAIRAATLPELEKLIGKKAAILKDYL